MCRSRASGGRLTQASRLGNASKIGPFFLKYAVPISQKTCRATLLIKYFFNNPNKILSKEQIYRNVWGNDVVDDNTIMVHIRHLRVKIEADATRPNYLRTIRGVGYQFVI